MDNFSEEIPVIARNIIIDAAVVNGYTVEKGNDDFMDPISRIVDNINNIYEFFNQKLLRYVRERVELDEDLYHRTYLEGSTNKIANHVPKLTRDIIRDAVILTQYTYERSIGTKKEQFVEAAIKIGRNSKLIKKLFDSQVYSTSPKKSNNFYSDETPYPVKVANSISSTKTNFSDESLSSIRSLSPTNSSLSPRSRSSIESTRSLEEFRSARLNGSKSTRLSF